MKIITVVGARPQFIKAAAISRVIATHYATQIEEQIIHTGQHFDENMSKVFFDDLGIPEPHHHFAISGGYHGAMTGKMLEAVEGVLLKEKPDWVMVYGDTNSTLAGALAGAKLHIPVAHVEAGLRSFNMRMPEEVNRILSDRVSSLLFCPTETAVRNLSIEGITSGVLHVGDVMLDVALHYRDIALERSTIQRKLGLEGRQFVLATCHRAENTDEPQRLAEILTGLATIAKQTPVIFPLHPRTRKIIESQGLNGVMRSLTVLEPLSFLDMIALEQSAQKIITDSGGVQKEAFFFSVPCITTRDETEWTETVDSRGNVLVGACASKIVEAFETDISPDFGIKPYGNGQASSVIVSALLSVR